MKKSLIVAGLLAINSIVFAAETLPQITITTNARYEQNVEDVINSTTVITRQDIEDLSPSTTSELLNNVAGINISSNGGFAATTSVYLRGLKSGKEVSVLINGVVALGDGVDGFSWENIDPETIERIEIIRGAKATTYGDGSTATINIITKYTETNSIKFSSGSFGTQKQTVSIGGKHNNITGVSATIVQEKSTGFSATNKNSSDYEDDDDGFSRKSLNLYYWVKPSDNSKISATVLNNTLEYDYDSSFTPNSKSKRDNNGISLQFGHSVNDIWNYSTKSSNSSRSEYSNDTREQTNFINHFTLGQNKLSIGNDVNRFKTDGAYATHKKLISNAIFANWNGKINSLSYEIGHRKTEHNIFDNYETSQMGVAYQIIKGLKIKTNSGIFTNIPSAYQLNGNALDGVNANPDLKPQTTKTTDLGLVYRDKSIAAEISFYRTKITDPITYKGKYETPANQYVNGEKTNFKGVDISYKQKFSNGLIMKSTITKLDYPIDNGQGKKIAQLKRPDKFTLSLNKKFNFKTNMGLNILSVGKATDAGDKELDDYHLINFNTKYKFTKNISLGLKIENLTDEKYETTYGYNTSNRAYYLTLQFKQ